MEPVYVYLCMWMIRIYSNNYIHISQKLHLVKADVMSSFDSIIDQN